ncbi:MAG: guanylate kinase [Lachnospiraceae bacterium]|nr:guanylate kinase [Lachnospiraceae bacterium]
MAEKGILTVVSGFSGAGKGTVMKALTERFEGYALSVSATTRAPRPGEQDGREYFFRTKEQFQKMIAEDALIEYACYVSHYYGTPREYVECRLAEGKDVLLEIEIQGALKVKKRYPDALLVFIMPPTAAELRARLIGRGTETEEVVKRRLKRAAEEAEGMEAYDYILVNDTVEACAQRLHRLIQSQHMRASVNKDCIERMKRELEEINAGTLS